MLEMLQAAQREALTDRKVTGYTLLPAESAAGKDAYVLHTDTPHTFATSA